MRAAMAVVVLVPVFCLAGCEQPCPFPRLSPGTEALVYDADAADVRIETATGRGMGGLDFDEVTSGTRITVLDDAGRERDPSRMVAIVVADGPKKGLPASLARRLLRGAAAR